MNTLKLGVDLRAGNGSMAQIILNSPGISAFCREVVAARMAEHVGMHATIRKFLITKSFHHPGKAHRGPWPAAF